MKRKIENILQILLTATTIAFTYSWACPAIFKSLSGSTLEDAIGVYIALPMLVGSTIYLALEVFKSKQKKG